MPRMNSVRNASPVAAFVATVAVATVVQLVATGDWLFHGGLFTDDWPIASIERFGGARELLDSLTAANSDRPLGNVYLTLTSAVSGTDPEMHALWGFVTHLICVIAVYYCARALGMALPSAAAMGLLVMLFPYSDSIWLWYAASHSSLAIAFGAIGVLLAVRGLRSSPAWPWHLGTAVAFAASVLTYQVIAVSVLLMLALYLPRTDRRTAFLLWGKDIASVALAALLPSFVYGERGVDSSPLVESVDEGVRHAEQIVDQGFALFGAALFPFGESNPDAVVFVAIVLILAGSAVAAWGPRDLAAGVRRSLTAILLGAGIVATAFVLYVPAVAEYYRPLVGGGGNRINALPGIGYCLIVVALATLAARLISALPGFPRAATTPLALVLVLGVAVGYAIQVDEDIGDWSRAADIQEQQLAQLGELGRLPDRSADYVFGGIGETAPGVFSFRVAWDLNNAVRLYWDDPDRRSYPIFEGTRMQCGPDGLFPDGPANGMGPQHGAAYLLGAYFTDLRTGERVHIEDRRDCLIQSRRFVPGDPTG